MYDIALVGPGGFLGSAVSRALRARGRDQLTFTRTQPLVVDGAVDPTARDVRTVIWAAGGISPAIAHDRPDVVADELARFRDDMSVIADLPVPPRVVLLSSGGTVYGRPGEPPFAETAPAAPVNAYGEFKLAQEATLEEFGLPRSVLRIANAYGPGQTGAGGQGVLAFWMKAVRAHEPIRILGDPDVARDYVFVDDVAEAVVSAIDVDRAAVTMNIGSGHPTSLNELATCLTGVVGSDRARVEHLPARSVDAESTWLDVALADAAIGWRATTPLAQGVERMWRWMAEE